MGTRSLTHIYQTADDKKPFVTIYRHFDGYPEGIGADIKRILGDRELVNGYNDKSRQTNGMACAAALLVSGLKKNECGNVYLYPAGAKDKGEDYTYRLYPAEPGFRFVIDGIYDGPLSAFDPAASEVEA